MANVTLTNKAKIVILFANQYDMKPKVLPGFVVQGMIQPETAPEAKEPGKAAK